MKCIWVSITTGLLWGRKKKNIKTTVDLFSIKKENFFSIKVNQNSMRVGEMTFCFIKAAPLYGGNFSLQHLLQTTQSWYFQDMCGLCLTARQTAHPEPPVTTPQRETFPKLSVEIKFYLNTRKSQAKIDSIWVWMPSTWIKVPEMSSKTGINTLQSSG